jgi:hypothetical protein
MGVVTQDLVAAFKANTVLKEQDFRPEWTRQLRCWIQKHLHERKATKIQRRTKAAAVEVVIRKSIKEFK